MIQKNIKVKPREVVIEMGDTNNPDGLVQDSLVRAFGTPTDKQLEKINEKARRPLSKEEVFTFPNKLVGDRLIESRNVKLHRSLLEVYKHDAQAGIAFMLDHPWSADGFLGLGGRPRAAYNYGRSFDASLKKGDVEGEAWALHADFYMVRDREKEGINTNDIIADIEDGVLFDTSIGFRYDLPECSICGNDIRDGANCEHYPGQTYDDELCYIVAKPPGNLMENSGVFDGAYDSAGILSATGDVAKGAMVPVSNIKSLRPDIAMINTYSSGRDQLLTLVRRDELVKDNTMVFGVNLTKGGGNKVSDKYSVVLDGMDITKHITEVNADASEVKVSVSEAALSELPTVKAMIESAVNEALAAQPADVDVYVSAEKAKDSLGKEVAADEFVRFAKEGQAHLESLQQEAKEWGVRAKGDKFDADAWAARFAIASADELKGFILTFKDEAEASIPPGRSTEPGAASSASNEIPDDAYKA